MSHSRKLTQTKVGVTRTSSLQPVTQKHRWQLGLATGIWSGGWSCRTEPCTCGIWFHLWVKCQNQVEFLDTLLVSENCLLVWGSLHTHTLKLSPVILSVSQLLDCRNKGRRWYYRSPGPMSLHRTTVDPGGWCHGENAATAGSTGGRDG